MALPVMSQCRHRHPGKTWNTIWQKSDGLVIYIPQVVGLQLICHLKSGSPGP